MGHFDADHPPSWVIVAGRLTPTKRTLAVTIARAHRWQQVLESGRCTTIGELARDVGVDNSYLARMLRLALPAPDIIESILNGTEPDGLSLGKPCQAPVEWEEQTRVLGPCGQGRPPHSVLPTTGAGECPWPAGRPPPRGAQSLP
jgi:hypothetical protein